MNIEDNKFIIIIIILVIFIFAVIVAVISFIIIIIIIIIGRMYLHILLDNCSYVKYHCFPSSQNIVFYIMIREEVKQSAKHVASPLKLLDAFLYSRTRRKTMSLT
jgi:hypothetical protein